eukprot:Plantae.Rhodophyta-Palmaria_palmata.ctg7160.p1 GENE.Plantae.Rhodophyta-Palmaria_palmata.ctg7160~~Plantae.Rhodophyta-Palmaria_palmata.ctg7160.p1  ORF type:complete len:214 (+),score=32.09 Plantae.Rhodophyta-Palmaria_palmata.ctg7160:171-812(+)
MTENESALASNGDPSSSTDSLNRPFKCDQCSLRFRKRCNAINHKKIVHEKLKPFNCSYCRRAFGKKSNCQKHERLHMHGTYKPKAISSLSLSDSAQITKTISKFSLSDYGKHDETTKKILRSAAAIATLKAAKADKDSSSLPMAKSEQSAFFEQDDTTRKILQSAAAINAAKNISLKETARKQQTKPSRPKTTQEILKCAAALAAASESLSRL